MQIETPIFQEDNSAGGKLADWLGWGSAKKQRDFEQFMSNTSYQRAVADMQKAGLNPALAYQNGGADSPVSAMTQATAGNNGIGNLLVGTAQLISSLKLNNKKADNKEIVTSAAKLVEMLASDKK